jgi:hypothetical protein
MTENSEYTYTMVNGIKTSDRWVDETTTDSYYTDNIYLIPQDNNITTVRKLIKPTDFLSGSNINVTTKEGTTTKRTEGCQRLKVWSLGDLQYPGSSNPPNVQYPEGKNTMRWEHGSHAIGIAYNPATSFKLYGGVTLFHNQDERWLGTADYPMTDITKIYCYVPIPYGYKVTKSYIYVADLRKSPYQTEQSGNNLLINTNSNLLDFDGMTMKSQIISVGGINNDFTYIKSITDTDEELRDKHFVNNIIYYEESPLLKNNLFNVNKTLLISLKYTGTDITQDIITENDGYKEVIFNSIFAVIKGGWVEFEKI